MISMPHCSYLQPGDLESNDLYQCVDFESLYDFEFLGHATHKFVLSFDEGMYQATPGSGE